MPRAYGLSGPQLSFLAVAALLLAACSSANREQRFEFTRLQMGVQSRIVLYATDARKAESAAAGAYARISRIDTIMSDYRADSELNGLSDSARGPAVPVSEELFGVLEVAARVSEASQGAFDITVGPCVALWRESRHSGRMPSADRLARARALVGWRMVHLDPVGRTARLDRAGMRLDLGGIAKGYAAEIALDELRRRGHPVAMVALAGDIAAGERPPGSRGWRVRIAPDGIDDRGETLELHLQSISTSGSAEQGAVVDGVRYSHIVDPRTGLGATAATWATTVLHHDPAHPGFAGAIVDATSTAVTIRGGASAAVLSARFTGLRVFVSGVGGGPPTNGDPE